MVGAARQRAQLAYAELSAVVQDAHKANVDLLRNGMEPILVGQYQPPQPTQSTSNPAELVRLFDGQAHWYSTEASQLKQRLAAVRGALSDELAPAAPLARGPRAVPLAMRFAEVAREPWRFLRLFLFPPFTMLGALPVIGLVAVHPLAASAFVLVLLAALWSYGVLVGLKRARLLAVGEVATVLQRTELPTSTRNRNVPMLRARRWKVFVESYTGVSRKTELVLQSPRGSTIRITLRHGPPFDGVVLIDPETGYACANLELGSCPTPDASGQWTGALSTRTWLTSITGVLFTAALAIGAIAAPMGS